MEETQAGVCPDVVAAARSRVGVVGLLALLGFAALTVSRVLLGLHYRTYVAAGVLPGTAWLSACNPAPCLRRPEVQPFEGA